MSKEDLEKSLTEYEKQSLELMKADSKALEAHLKKSEKMDNIFTIGSLVLTVVVVALVIISIVQKLCGQ